MVKQASAGGFLSKVARFVRHPTVDWAELDVRGSGVQEEREALKAALQRKRRNDKVRHRELNDLRDIMTRQRVAAEAGGQTSPSLSPSTQGGIDKSRTIEQIARIEEQMSAHWLQRQGGDKPGGGATIPARVERAAAVPAHLRTRDAGTTTFPMTIDLVVEDLHPQGSDWDAALSHATLAEAAVRFANGQFDEAQRSLRALMVQEALSPTARAAAVVLRDLLFAQGDLEGFEEFAAEYAERFSVPVPRWPAGPAKGLSAAGPAPMAGDAAAPSRWVCPMLLDTQAVAALQHVVAQAAGPVWLDWTDLVSADLPAAQALLALTDSWLTQPLDFRVRGAAVLRRRLKAGTPSGREENERVWWSLRLSLLRLMHRRDEFDLAALDYCVTYGVLPPEWAEPCGRFSAAESLPPPPVLPEARPLAEGAPAVDLDAQDWPALSTTLVGAESRFPALPTVSSVWPAATVAAPSAVALTGHLLGEIPVALAALDAALAGQPKDHPLVVGCQGLLRVDFAAAGSLLQWFMAATGRGQRVELDGVSPLIGAFFHVVGIDEAVTVRLRQY